MNAEVFWTAIRRKRVLQGATLAVILVASVVALLAFVHSWAPPNDYRCFESLGRSQFPKWLGCVMAVHQDLAAGLIAAAGALFAGWLAFACVQRQLEEERYNRDRKSQEAKLAAVLAITPAIQAASMMLLCVRQALAAIALTEQATFDALVKRGAGHVETALQSFLLREIVGDLGADDRTIFISIIATLASMVDMSKTQNIPRITNLNTLNHALMNVRTYLQAFNDELAAVFNRDAGL